MFDFNDPIFSFDGGDPLLSWDVPQDYFSNTFGGSGDNVFAGGFTGNIGTGYQWFDEDYSGGAKNPISASDLDRLASDGNTPYENNDYVDPGAPIIDRVLGGVGQGAKSVGEFMTKNKLWAPALAIGAGALDRYSTNKQQRENEEEARRRKRMGVVSGRGLSLWRSSPKAQQQGGA